MIGMGCLPPNSGLLLVNVLGGAFVEAGKIVLEEALAEGNGIVMFVEFVSQELRAVNPSDGSIGELIRRIGPPVAPA